MFIGKTGIEKRQKSQRPYKRYMQKRKYRNWKARTFS